MIKALSRKSAGWGFCFFSTGLIKVRGFCFNHIDDIES